MKWLHTSRVASAMVLGLLASLAHSFSPQCYRTRSTVVPSRGRLFAGPKEEGRRRRSRGGTRSQISEIARERSRTTERVTELAFDGQSLTAAQNSNEGNFQPLDLKTCIQDGSVRVVTSADEAPESDLRFGSTIDGVAFEFRSLEELFGKPFSEAFHSDSDFRRELREAIRKDVFDTTPAYSNLPEKAVKVMLLPDSSLQGSWRKSEEMKDELRMKETTTVLAKKLGEGILSGDQLMHTIGGLCGTKPSTHWIDIVGVQDRVISHSFHQDTGLSPEQSKTVLWGFPPHDQYCGTGVFSHIVQLAEECEAPVDHPRMQPVLLDGQIPHECIIRPEFAVGKELIVYRDVDVLHSSPDVAYRMSVMRFM